MSNDKKQYKSNTYTDKMLWTNGTFQPDTAPVFTIHDRIRYADGVFDTMLAVDGVPVDLDLHLERLIRHTGIINITPSPPWGEGRGGGINCKDIYISLLTQNNFTIGKAVINTIITRGESARGLRVPEEQNPTIIIKTGPAPDMPAPIHAIISQTTRSNEGSPLSRIKSLQYADNILALKEAKDNGATEALMINNAGYVTCATIGNVFAVTGDTLLTPPLSDGVIDGITRAKIMAHYSVREQSLKPDDLLNADGVYITNSLRGAVPVASLNGTSLPQPTIIHDVIPSVAEGSS